MPPASLKKLLGKKGRLAPLIAGLVREMEPPVSILDAGGEVLFGPAPEIQPMRFPILAADLEAGHVYGGPGAAGLADLLSVLLEQEYEKKALAAEVLERYRELNLLYNFSNKLAVTPQPEAIAVLAMDEATRLIHSRSGMIVLATENKSEFVPAATHGVPCQLVPGEGPLGILLQRVIELGKGEIINDIPCQDYLCECVGGSLSLIVSPLKTEKLIFGAIILASDEASPFSAGDLKLLTTITQQAAPAIEIARLHQIAIEKARMEHEVKMAFKVQSGLLPRAMPEPVGWSFSAVWRPARGVSGDFYDLIPLRDHQLGLVIADVTDKSLPAALFMAFTRSILRATLDRYTTPVEALSRANQLICQESNQGLFVTLFYAQIDLDSGQVTYVNAGHNPPLLYRASEDCLDSLAPTGLPLGIDEDSPYRQNTARIEPGDFILCYTDGITEAFNDQEEQFGLEQLEATVRENHTSGPEELVSAIQARVKAFVGAAETSDDITLLAARRLLP